MQLFSPPLGVKVSAKNPGKIVAKGAEVTLPISITCPKGSSTYLNVTLSETVGKTVTSNGAYAETPQIKCDAKSHKFTFAFQPQSGGKPYKAGAAAISGTLQVYVPRKGSTTLTINGKVTLKK